MKVTAELQKILPIQPSMQKKEIYISNAKNTKFRRRATALAGTLINKLRIAISTLLWWNLCSSETYFLEKV